ncbi:uncharacterized protein LOC18099474 isoform X2 [Populus trichocarpa]|uniref:uncharacterized protein LOC18099474 isoform X2 n=1 Tax=Populus trichocarpa TaxID=3694 RepID=UPI000D18897F|nr:uncharacterized protein LOC18099474 isoform X2 [Populus trichocarpa]|eukprot:XP_024445156.1 uncharacterized protein LOC18099474 isoform X2 [Populus trichocarpa]
MLKKGEEEDEKREEAIASNPSLQPNFKPKRVTQDQLSKLQELHKRRLQIKSKIHKKSKDGTGKSHGKDLKSKDTGTNIEDSGAPDLKPLDDNASFSTPQDNVSAHHSEKKRQKLHWGLDTKERWERKANM